MSTHENHESIILETTNDRFEFERETGKLASWRAKTAPGQELLEVGEADPAFVVQYLDSEKRFRQITSRQAEEIDVELEGDGGEDAQELIATFRRLGDLDIDVTVKVRASNDDRFSYWSVAVTNRAGLLITDVQFPFIVVPYEWKGAAGSERLLWPFRTGHLMESPKPEDLEPDSPHTWQFHPENEACGHYPGLIFAQFLAYYNDQVGVYVSCQDSSGRMKLIKPVHHGSGVRLGIAHVGDWPRKGERELEYEVVLGSFSGDWYDAATLYKDWSLKQPWARTGLGERKDVPEWLLDSPPNITFRVQGELDAGCSEPKEEFLPYRRTIPLLEKVAERLESPLMPMVMGLEKPGPWIYPESLPPVGGAESLREFTELARERSWHVGVCCSGTRWVTANYWSGYDGRDYFEKNGGEGCVCRTHEGQAWKEVWDRDWRASYDCCLGVRLTHELAEDYMAKLIDMGIDWIYFLDQNFGCAAFSCYATDHGHPPTPGKWMTEEMDNLLATSHKLAAAEYERTERQIVFCTEEPTAEYFIPKIQICDVLFAVPPGYSSNERPHFVPLYHFLYHEFAVIHSTFGYGPNPYNLQIRNAYCFVLGEIVGAVLKGNGRLLNKAEDIGEPWQAWYPEVGDNEAALAMMRSATALRRGAGRDFLVYGRMLRPAEVREIKTMRWQEGGHDNAIPAVFHSAWQGADERVGIVLANWTTETQEVCIADERLGDKARGVFSSDEVTSEVLGGVDGSFRIAVPGVSCVLLTAV